MKTFRNLMLLALLTFVAVPAHAKLSFALMAGVTFSNPSLTDYQGISGVTQKPRPGLTAGLGLDFDLGARTGLALEGLYTQKGYRLLNDTDVLMNWVFIPVYLRFNLMFLDVLAGAYYAQGIGSVTVQAPSSFTASPTNWATVLNWGSTNFGTSDWGALVGLKCSVAGNAFLTARYYWGAKNILVNAGSAKFRNASIDVLFGVSI